MRRTTALTVLSLLAACRVALPPAVTTPRGHGLQRVWIESLGLE